MDTKNKGDKKEDNKMSKKPQSERTVSLCLCLSLCLSLYLCISLSLPLSLSISLSFCLSSVFLSLIVLSQYYHLLLICYAYSQVDRRTACIESH